MQELKKSRPDRSKLKEQANVKTAILVIQKEPEIDCPISGK